MKISYLYEGLLFVLLVLLQVLLLSRIALFGIVTPVVYIYFLIKLPIGRTPFYVIISGFLLGIVIDIFFNTPGMNAAATTIVAAFRGPIMNLFFERVEHDYSYPAFTMRLGRSSVSLFLSFLCTLPCSSSLSRLPSLIREHVAAVVTSVVVSVALILAMDSLTYKKRAVIKRSPFSSRQFIISWW